MGRCLSQNIETCQNATKFASVVKLCQKYLCSDQMGFIEVSKLLFQPIYVLKSTHTHTRQAKLFFLFVKSSFCQMERSGVVWGDYVSRLQLYLIHLFKTPIIESRFQTLPLVRWMRMQQTIYLSYRGSRVPGEGKWGPRGTRITDGASLDPLLATQVVCTYYRWCKMLLTRCGWYVIICGASSGIE